MLPSIKLAFCESTLHAPIKINLHCASTRLCRILHHSQVVVCKENTEVWKETPEMSVIRTHSTILLQGRSLMQQSSAASPHVLSAQDRAPSNMSSISELSEKAAQELISKLDLADTKAQALDPKTEVSQGTNPVSSAESSLLKGELK